MADELQEPVFRGWLKRLYGARIPATLQVSRQYANVIDAYGRSLRTRIEGGAARAAVRGEPARDATLSAQAKRIDDLLAAFAADGLAGAKDVFARILGVELAYFHATDEADQYATARAARERFQRVAAPQAVALRNSSQVPELTLPLSEPAMSDTIELLNYIHAQYILEIAREVEVTDQKVTLLFRLQTPILVLSMGALLTLAGALLWRAANSFAFQAGRPIIDLPEKVQLFMTQVPYFLLGILIILALGYAGSIVSVAQRFQRAVDTPVLSSDPVFSIGGLAAGWNGVRLAMASAAVFAGIAYLIFASGLANALGISGGVFPAPVGSSECGAGPPASDAVAWTATHKAFRTGSAGDRFAFALGLCSRTELMKMFVIAFLAGFSERLVPDILSEIANRAVPRPVSPAPNQVPAETIERGSAGNADLSANGGGEGVG